jgi:hypothetical protein
LRDSYDLRFAIESLGELVEIGDRQTTGWAIGLEEDQQSQFASFETPFAAIEARQ